MEFLKIPEVIEFTLTFKDLVQSENGHSRNKLNSITGKKENGVFFTLGFYGLFEAVKSVSI